MSPYQAYRVKFRAQDAPYAEKNKNSSQMSLNAVVDGMIFSSVGRRFQM